MGLNFRKSIKICKGVKLNIGTSGVSISGGVKGARLSMHSSGRKTATIGIPGTGLSYSKSFGGKKKSGSKTAAKTTTKKATTPSVSTEDAAKQVVEYETYLSNIRSVHKTCDNVMDWQEVYQSAPPFVLGSLGPKEVAATEMKNSYKPSFLDKLTGKAKQKEKELTDNIANAKAEDVMDYENWKTMKEFSSDILKGDLDAYINVIEETQPFAELAELGSDFEFGTNDPKSMTVEFHVKSEQVVPTQAVTLTPTKKLSTKKLTKTQYYDYVQDYVCSLAIRLAREVFASLPVETCLVHAVDTALNPATGNMEDATILSVRFERSGFKNINFDRIDPSDFVFSFEYNMGFTKTGGFKPIRPLV